MADEPEPPRKYYQLKQREFELLNDPPSAFGPQGRQPEPKQPTQKIDVRDLCKQASTPGLVLSKDHKPMANDVHVILRDNHTRATAAGLNELTPNPKRRSRRTRDYFLLLIPLDAFFAFAAFGPFANPVTFVYGIGGIAITTVALTWVMFFIVDDY